MDQWESEFDFSIMKDIASYLPISSGKQQREENIKLSCQLTKEIVRIPVRHQESLDCLFEKENLKLLLQSLSQPEDKGKKGIVIYYQGQEEQFECPGCRLLVRLSSFKIDYNLYQAIETFKWFKVKMTQEQQKEIKADELRFNNFDGISYFAIRKDNTIIKLPGFQEFPQVQRYIHRIQQMSPNLDFQKKYLIKICESCIQTTQRLHQFLKIRKQSRISKYQIIEYPPYQVQKDPQNSAKEIFLKNCELIKPGKTSLDASNFVFGFKLVKKKHQNYSQEYQNYEQKEKEVATQSLLVLYYPNHDLWLDFELEWEHETSPFIQLQKSLYIKEAEDFSIYIVGGIREQRGGKQEVSRLFAKIELPKKPEECVAKKLLVKMYPDLIQGGYNYVGTALQRKVFIFYGQFFGEVKGIIESQHVTHAFIQHKWQDLRLELFRRYDGGHIILKHPKYDKLLIFFGGTEEPSDGRDQSKCKVQKLGQVFSCKEQIFLGKGNGRFELTVSQVDLPILMPILAIPYYDKSYLLFRKSNQVKIILNKEPKKQQICNYNWKEGLISLHEFFSCQPLQQTLEPQKLEGSSELFTSIQDLEGSVTNGIYHTIYLERVQEQNALKIQALMQTSLLMICQNSGQTLFTPFQNRDDSLKRFNERYREMQLENSTIKVD